MHHLPPRDPFRSLRAAIDLASIMVGVIVVGVIAGIIAATVFSVIPWVQTEAAKQTLSAVADAESTAKTLPGTGGTAGRYRSVDGLRDLDLLSGDTIARVAVNATGDCYASALKSHDQTFFIDPEHPDPVPYDGIAANPSVCNDINFPALVFNLPDGSDANAQQNPYSDQCLDGGGDWKIKDPALESWVRSNYGIAAGTPIPMTRAVTMTTFAVAPSVASLEGLQCATAMNSLTLANTQVADLTPIQGLKGIISVNFTNNVKLKNLAGLSGLSGLTTVQISTNTNLESLDGFENNPAVTTVQINGNAKLADISGMKNLPALTALNVNFSPLLKSADISFPKVTQTVLMGNTLLTDVSFRNMDNWQSVSVSSSGVKNMTFENVKVGGTFAVTLSSATNLETVSLKNVTGATSLIANDDPKLKTVTVDGAPALTSVQLQRDVALTTVGSYKNAPLLKTITTSYNTVMADPGTYDSTVKLTQLTLGRSAVTSLAFLTQQPTLTKVDVTGRPIAILSTLPGSFVGTLQISVDAAQMTAAEATAFASAHPGVTIKRV